MKTARRVIGVLALIGIGVSFVAWCMLIFTGACFDEFGFSIWVPIVFFSFAGCGVTATICIVLEIIAALKKNGSISFGQTEENKVCFHCGAQMKADAKFCTNCGKVIEGEEK